MKILVQKFGGTSVATPEARRQVIEKIINARKQGYRLVVVVSAMGRQGAPYATDTLKGLLEASGTNVSPREMDLILSCGEIISGTVLTGSLQAAGFKAIFLTGAQAGIITDNRFGNATIRRVDPGRILSHLEEDKIVVVAGFQGITEDGEITTIGRGGSDTTAAALGVALDAEAVEIYTDVDGIKTADPRIVSDARTLDTVTYNEICQLAHEGARVVHPRAVEIAMQKNIPLKIKCTFNDEPGTVVTGAGVFKEGGATILNGRVITGITQIPGLTQLRINTGALEDKSLQVKMLKALARANISIDFINISPEAMVFTVKDEVSSRAVRIIEDMKIPVAVKKGCAKVAVVGAGMTGVPGVMANIVEALADEGIEILESADSYTTIWCLVEEAKMEKAVQALHRKFNLGK